MKYQKKFPLCPFQSQGTGKCSHKGCSTCTYLKHPEKCELYNLWVDKLKDDFDTVENPLQSNLPRSDNPKRPKRCTKCNKIIRQENKSGLCSRCYRNKIKRDTYWKKKSPTTKLSLYGK